MTAIACRLLLAASLLVNAGVLAAVWLARAPGDGAGERALFGMGHDRVAAHLRLDAAQRERWRSIETGFVDELNRVGQRIAAHRTRMVHAILSDQPDAATIERERAAIFALQEAQQRAVIAQLLREREMLNADQRTALAELLLSRHAGALPGR